MTTLPLMFDSATPWDRQRLEHIKRLSPNGGVSIYIRGTPGGMRHASADDVKLIREIQLAICPNWESLADFFRTANRPACVAAGKEAAQALHDLGLPTDGSLDVPFSFDYEISPGDFAAEADKLAAAQEGLGKVARATAYGQSAFITYLHNHGFGDRVHWLMMSTFNLPYDINQPGVGVVQAHDEHGNWIQDSDPIPASDINTVVKPDQCGFWWPDGSPYGGDSVATVDHLNDSAVRDILQFPLVTDKDGKTVTTIGQALRQGLRADTAQAEAFKAIQAKLAHLNLQGPEAAAVQAAVEEGLHDFYSKAVAQ